MRSLPVGERITTGGSIKVLGLLWDQIENIISSYWGFDKVHVLLNLMFYMMQ